MRTRLMELLDELIEELILEIEDRQSEQKMSDDDLEAEQREWSETMPTFDPLYDLEQANP